jgi:hypothetical protein
MSVKGWRKGICKRGHDRKHIDCCGACYVCKQIANMCWGAKKRARDNGVPFSITPDDVHAVWPADNLCPIFRTPLMQNRRKGLRNDSPTLDRVINEKGYVKGNIAIISWRANTVKSNLPQEIFLRIADYMASHLLSDGNRSQSSEPLSP